MEIRETNEETRSFWGRAMSAEKFEKDGLWGLKTPSGDIVLEPRYDQIEFCTDFVYVHYDNRHKFFYKSGSTRDCPDYDDDYRFYENGKIGIRNMDGSEYLPAAYDEIIDWGKGCDVIYVRKGKEFHYYNHNQEEILTEIEVIPEDAYPECPYNLGEDQNRNVLVCVEPIEKKEGNRDCFAYNQWVRLSRIPCSKVREMFSNCKVVPMSSDAINHFDEEDTYIYSARVCSANGKYPITKCIDKFKTLGCYDSSWEYLLKISINKNTTINPSDLYNAIKHFESKGGCEIAVDYDGTLDDGVVRVFQIHFFWDDMGAFLNDNFKQHVLPDCNVEVVQKELEQIPLTEKRKYILEAFWWIVPTESTRSWFETRKVLEYLKSVGSSDFTTLVCKSLEITPYYMEEITPVHWKTMKEIILWAISNGGQINSIHSGKTLYEGFLENLKEAKDETNQEAEFYESVKNGELLAEWLIEMGGTTAAKQRKRIASRLDGLTPQEVLDLASLKSFFIPRAYIDYAYEEEKEGQNDYKFVADEVKHCFRQGDWVLLIVVGRPDYQFGNIIKVEDDSIFIHTDEWLDISEEYSISLA